MDLDLSRDFYFLYKSLCHRQDTFCDVEVTHGALSARCLPLMLHCGETWQIPSTSRFDPHAGCAFSAMFSWPVWNSETQWRLLTLKSCLSCVRVGTSRKKVRGLLSNGLSLSTLSWRLDPVCWCPCPTGFWHQLEWTCYNDIEVR